MSTMAVAAMPVTLTAPQPAAPPFGLVPTAQVVVDEDEHYLDGGSVWPYPRGLPFAWNPCERQSKRDDDTYSADDWTDFGAFTVVLPFFCTGRSIGDWNEIKDRLLAAFAARESFALEAELVAGDPAAAMPENVHLGDAGMLSLGSGVSTAEALALLENAIGATGEQGVIHATPALIAEWGYDRLTVSAGKLRTINGNLVVSGGGYIGAKGATGDQDWAFATGPVHIRRSAPFVNPDDLADAIDRQNNDVIAYAERYYQVTWNPEHLHVGVLSDRSA